MAMLGLAPLPLLGMAGIAATDAAAGAEPIVNVCGVAEGAHVPGTVSVMVFTCVTVTTVCAATPWPASGKRQNASIRKPD